MAASRKPVPSETVGTGMGRIARQVDMAWDAAEGVVHLGERILQQLADMCRGPKPARAPAAWPDSPGGEDLEKVLLFDGTLRPSTARRYRQIADRFRQWFLAGGDIGEDEGAVDQFLAEMAGGTRDPQHRALSRVTVYAVRSAIDRLWGRRLSQGVALPPRPPPVTAVAAETVAALDRAAEPAGPDRLLLVLCCGVGLRPGQIAGLRRRDVNLDRGWVRFEARGKRREEPIPPECREVLRECLRGYGAGEYLFPSGRPGERPVLTVRALQGRLRRLAERAGVSEAVTFERLRRAGAEGRGPWGKPAGDRGHQEEPSPEHAGGAGERGTEAPAVACAAQGPGENAGGDTQATADPDVQSSPVQALRDGRGDARPRGAPAGVAAEHASPLGRQGEHLQLTGDTNARFVPASGQA